MLTFFFCVFFILMLLEAIIPGTFAFLESVLTAVINFLNGIILFFQGIFTAIVSFFGFFGDIFNWLIIKLGEVLAPVVEVVPDSPVVPLVVCLLLGLLFFLLKKPGDDLNPGNFDEYLKRTYAWCCTSFIFGMIVAGSGHPHGAMSVAFEGFFLDSPMTLLNYEQWSEYAHKMLNYTIIGGTLTSIIFALLKGPRSCIRTWVGLAFCGTLGYMYMIVRLAITYWLAVILGFLGGLLNIAVMLFEYLILLQYFFGIILFILPMSVIKAFNTASADDGAQKTRTRSAKPAKSENSLDHTDVPFPAYVTDDSGNEYSVTRDGDYIYIELPGGRISTKWEYIKGQSYFDLEGKRFYPH